MKDYIELIKTLLEEKEPETQKVITALQHLYFSHVKSWRKSIQKSEPYYLAKDVIEIEQRLGWIADLNPERKVPSPFDGLALKSHTLLNNSLMKECLKAQSIEIHIVNMVKEKIVNPNKYNITAVMIAEMLKQEERKIVIGKVTNVFLGILSILFALTTALLGYLLSLIGGM